MWSTAGFQRKLPPSWKWFIHETTWLINKPGVPADLILKFRSITIGVEMSMMMATLAVTAKKKLAEISQKNGV